MKSLSSLVHARLAPLISLLVGGVFIFHANPACAGLIFEIQNSSAVSGGTGSFDVVLHDTGGNYMVSGFSLQLTLASNSGVQFTGATTATTSSYIFGTYQSAPSPFASDPNNPTLAAQFPLNNFVASDTDLTGPNYYVGMKTDDRFGLAHVTYSVARGTSPGSFSVSFNMNGTSLSDVDGNAIPFSAPTGSINVVPEPASIISLVAGLAGVALVRPLRRRVPRPAPSNL